jgi:hypothetical protein
VKLSFWLEVVMTHKEFQDHIPIINEGRFELEPMPRNVDRSHRFFKFQDCDHTHMKLLDDTGALLYLSLNMIELINPGNPAMVVTKRQMRLDNQSFV